VTERDMAILVRTIAEEVEDLVKGKNTSGFTTIETRLKRFGKQYDEHVANKGAAKLDYTGF